MNTSPYQWQPYGYKLERTTKGTLKVTALHTIPKPIHLDIKMQSERPWWAMSLGEAISALVIGAMLFVWMVVALTVLFAL